jgi:hypothetical protein
VQGKQHLKGQLHLMYMNLERVVMLTPLFLICNIPREGRTRTDGLLFIPSTYLHTCTAQVVYLKKRKRRRGFLYRLMAVLKLTSAPALSIVSSNIACVTGACSTIAIRGRPLLLRVAWQCHQSLQDARAVISHDRLQNNITSLVLHGTQNVRCSLFFTSAVHGAVKAR